MHSISYTSLRKNLSSVFDDIEDSREVYCVTRKSHSDMIVIARNDYESLLETLHLLSSKKNAEKLRQSLKQADNQEYVKVNL